jgi:hypothetical protein
MKKYKSIIRQDFKEKIYISLINLWTIYVLITIYSLDQNQLW